MRAPLSCVCQGLVLAPVASCHARNPCAALALFRPAPPPRRWNFQRLWGLAGTFLGAVAPKVGLVPHFLGSGRRRATCVRWGRAPGPWFLVTAGGQGVRREVPLESLRGAERRQAKKCSRPILRTLLRVSAHKGRVDQEWHYFVSKAPSDGEKLGHPFAW